MESEQHGIKSMLESAGLLQYDQSDQGFNSNANPQANGGLRFSSNSSFRSYSDGGESDNNQQQPLFCTPFIIIL